ncbi:MAG: TRAP transporter small permease subunit [Desulfobacterium sp.]|nr:TRAP transporter small permease subunit [Desulfobacterium sp.]
MTQQRVSHAIQEDPWFRFMVQWIQKIDKFSELQGKVFSFLILIATFQICYELVLRYVFNAPTVWGLELTVYLCGITYIMSGAFAERYGVHIRVDVFYNKWPLRNRAWFDLLVTDMLLFFLTSVLIWHGGLWFWEAVTQGLTSGTIWDPQIWPMRLVIVMGAFFLMISSVPKFFRDFALAVWNVKL